jgi:hypothetical protein
MRCSVLIRVVLAQNTDTTIHKHALARRTQAQIAAGGRQFRRHKRGITLHTRHISSDFLVRIERALHALFADKVIPRVAQARPERRAPGIGHAVGLTRAARDVVRRVAHALHLRVGGARPALYALELRVVVHLQRLEKAGHTREA